ncbi:MAG TPA: radical SAM protein [Anaerolineae bacterium]|nr:radical SAM protein [Anaerolineae bacterium]
MTEFVVRPESFGATVYEPATLSYFFVDTTQFAQLQTGQHRLLGQGATDDHSRGTGTKSDISGGKIARMVTALAAGAKMTIRVSPEPLPTDTLAAPIRVYFELTLRCNARCTYCLNQAGDQLRQELTTEEVLWTIENFGHDGVFEVRLTGGEPLLRRDFWLIAHEVRQAGMTLSLNSNLLHGSKTMARLVELRPNLLITSLDAAQEPHTRNRGPGYTRIVRNVRLLRAEGVPVRLNCTLSRATLPYIERFIDEFAPLGCGFCFILIRPVGRAGEKFDPPPLRELIPVVRQIEAKQHRYPEAYFSTSFHVVMDREIVIGGINLTGCNAIQKSFNVNSDGAVSPCAFFYELSPQDFTLGNIRDENYSVLRIWRNSALLRTLRRRSSGCNVRCIACPHFKHDCLGTCIFMQLYSERTGRPDPYCLASVQASPQGVST